jgi:hypothetical protein
MNGHITKVIIPEQPFKWEPKVVSTLQDSYSHTFTFSMDKASKPLFLMIFRDPQAQLWWEMGELYRPFWWMDDE